MSWEYTAVTEATTEQGRDRLLLQLNALGSLGWEAVGLTAADPTLGLNSITVLLRREVPGLAEPADRTAGWRPDPSGRHAQRHWDGMRWTEHVVDAGGAQGTDFPNTRRPG